MPLPTPKTDEDKDEFTSRCMGELNEEFPDESQRRAVCEAQWQKDEADNMSKFEIKAKGEKAEILIYEDIGEGWLGGISAKLFADEVKKLGKLKEINVRINSYGGSVFDGLAIYNTLRNNPARIVVAIDGIAASIASIIAMAGDEISIAENGFIMIHDPWMVAAGTADDLREQADVMDKIRDSLLDTYMSKTKSDRDEISNMMKDETWLNAQEALDHGFVDSLTGEVKLAACGNTEISSKYRHIPDSLLLQAKETPRKDELKQKFAHINQILRKHKL